MVKMSMIYEGGLRCCLTHGPSGSEILTDAPVDNHGKGGAFSPTDLTAASLASCMLTVMGIAAQKNGIQMNGASAQVVKEMVVSPIRRIGSIAVKILMPKGIDLSKRELLEKTAHSCPVHQSLHPDVKIALEIVYPD